MRLEHLSPFPSKSVPSRNVEIWLPPGYQENGEQRYQVLYMHDGQNLFEPERSFIGVDWGIDAALTKLISEGSVPPTIVVGIWNTPNRMGEYMPDKALASLNLRQAIADEIQGRGHDTPYELNGDAYLQFIVTELKPYIDSHYPTLPDQPHTHIMGSSMGGLISLYAVCQYPDIFHGAGCLSTAWPIGDGILLPYFQQVLPPAANHRLYFDLGTNEDIGDLSGYQAKLDASALIAGYQSPVSILTLIFEGAEHSERAWRKRVHLPLKFLLAGKI